MNRIRLLSEQVANQIAAGEVIERPASVVKELVENSLDAGATRIVVEVVAAGRGVIKVTDDGCGMSRDDALLCLERHATSKIASASDLSRISTMGFRGEAIPSIASVSRFTLTTREHIEDPNLPGTQIVINGGKILEVREAGLMPGTSIEVRSLFFNVPARRKFLRSDDTERAHIQHWLTTAALAHPQVAFTLRMEGRPIWQLPALPPPTDMEGRLAALRERLRLLLGDGLTPVEVRAEGSLEVPDWTAANEDTEPSEGPAAEAISVWGWIGAPGTSRASRDDQYVFVNRRPVESRGLNAAVFEAYHNALMKGRYPVGCLFVEVNPAEVDVNIHPAKREVKFHRERAVRRFVTEAVRDGLRKWGESAATSVSATNLELSASAAVSTEAKAVPDNPEVIAGSPELAFGNVETRPRLFTRDTPGERIEPGGAIPRGAESPREELKPERVDVPRTSESVTTPIAAGSVVPAEASQIDVTKAGPQPPGTPTPSEPVPLLNIPLRIIGVLGRLYVLLESDRGLVLLDQHAAHERVLYEQMLRRLEHDGYAPSQRLLLPETIEVSPRDAAFLRENMVALARLGVGLSEFGERTFLLDALPPFVKVASPRRFTLELVDELRAAGPNVNSARLGEAVVAKTVCRHAVKANDPLSDREIEALITALGECDMPYTCPHGRPTLIEMSFRELEKKFGRIQG